MRNKSRFRRPLAVAAAAALTATLTAAGVGQATADAAGRGGDVPARCSAPGHQAITVVLVHGAWADSSGWSGEISRLQRAGCTVRAADNPVEGLTTDAEKVAAFVRAIPGPVLLVGHSYGGAVISNAAAQASNVVGLVYIDAYEPAVGEAIGSLNGATSVVYTHPKSELLQEVPGPDNTTNLLLTQKAYADYFGSDLTDAQAREGWASQTETSSLALETPAKYAAWQNLPSWSFISSNDQIITPDSLSMMAQRAHSKVTWFKGGSHLTLVTHPEAVTAVIGKALSALERDDH